MNQLVIITGLSGSGKSSALNALEDLDFYAIDNLPIKLLDKFIELIYSGAQDFPKVALVMDLRDQEFLENFERLFLQAKSNLPNVDIVYLDADEEVLTRRFSETRRKHPLSPKDIPEGIKKEIHLLQKLKDLASVHLDTSKMDVHQLKKRIIEQFGSIEKSELQVKFLSFGFKHGSPKNCDLMIDVRFLSNPHFVSELRDQNGLDAPVQEYIQKDSRFDEFVAKTLDYLEFLLPQYALEGKRYLSVGIGCTGGQHRSVFLAERLAHQLASRSKLPISCSSEHQDLHRSEKRIQSA